MHSNRQLECNSNVRLANEERSKLRNVVAFAVIVAVPLLVASATA
jgi:hypothetical protein